MGALLDGYRPDRAWDEMYAAVDEPRSHYRSLHHVLGTLSREDFELRCAAREDAEEWAVVEAGVRQRVLALERFLGDVYGPGEILADGVVPAGWSRAPRTSTGVLPGSTPRAASGCTSPVWISSATRPVAFGCWRTTCAHHRASRT